MKRKDVSNNPKPIILITDDSLTGRRALTAALHGEGYELSLASDGNEALKLAQQLEPDVILLDVVMPGMDGYEVCRQIRLHPRLREVPILLITALKDREERLQGIASGADDFISKPFDPLELRTKIRTIIRLNRYRKLQDGVRQLASIRRELRQLEFRKEHLQKLVHTDDLTRLHNRRSLFSKGRDEFNRAKRYNTHLSVLMIDIDRFKSINDTFGHKAGSLILKAVAAELKNNLRSMDVASRLGGDEFFILLPHTPLRSAQTLAERLRSAIEAHTFHITNTDIHITLSIGVSELSPSMKNVSELMEAADMALYRAKVHRNAVA